MAYRGETFVMDLNSGGFNYDKNTDRIPPVAMVGESINVNIHKGGRSKRGGTDNVNSSAIGGTPRIYGIYQYRQVDGTTQIISADANGEILKDFDDATPLKTGLTINKSVHFETFNNLLYICTGNNKVQVYNGSTVADITAPATEWNGVGANVNYPRKMITHGRGASQRLWAIGGATDPMTVFYSNVSAGDNSSEASFTAAGSGTIYVDTHDGHGILNAVEFGDRLICFGRTRNYIIDDSDSTLANWGYEQSLWEGGTANDRTVIQVENDLVSMTETGDIYSVSSAEAYGDYKKTMITRLEDGTPFMDEYIRDKVKLSAISDFHMVYDKTLRCIYFFIVRTGKTNVDTALTYFIDRGPVSGWTIKGNPGNDSGYKASCSTQVRKAAGDYVIYTGGWGDGFVWELETSTYNDNGAAYDSEFYLPSTHFGDPILTKRYDTVRAFVSTTGNHSLTMNVIIDGQSRSQVQFETSNSGAVYGTGTYGSGVYGGTESEVLDAPLGMVGKRIKYHIFNNNINEDYFVSYIYTDFKPLGRKAL